MDPLIAEIKSKINECYRLMENGKDNYVKEFKDPAKKKKGMEDYQRIKNDLSDYLFDPEMTKRKNEWKQAQQQQQAVEHLLLLYNNNRIRSLQYHHHHNK